MGVQFIKVTKRSKEENVLRLARRLKERGYVFSTYLNLARAIFDEEISSTWDGNYEDYIGLSPGLIKEVLLKHKDYIDELFENQKVQRRKS